MKVRKSEKGFTLIELMIVVGIIGILVAIAAPNFSTYQSKARQSEAKIALAAVYGAEKSFYSEFAAYMSGMDAIGYEPEGQKRFYIIGWSAASAASDVTGFSGTIGTEYYDRTNMPASWTHCNSFSAGLPGALTGNAQAFTIMARGQIRDGGTTAAAASHCDVWTIDDAKVLSNTSTAL